MDEILCFVSMATHFSQDRYARAKEKNQPLSEISTPPTKWQKTRSSIAILLSTLVHTPLVPSLIMSIEELPSPTRTHKGKEKKGKKVWTDLVTTFGQAHNVISNDKLKALSFVPSHEPISCHVPKLVQVSFFLISFIGTYPFASTYICFPQVLGESLCLTIDYLETEKKVAMANYKAEATKVKG